MRTLALVSLLLIAACTEPEPDPVDTTPTFKPPCDEFGCGNNGPVMGSHNFHDVHPGGVLANDAGLRLDGLWQGGVRYDVTVTRDRLSGTHSGMAPLAGTNLNGAYLRLLDAGGGEWRVYIENVSNTQQFWQFPADGRIETYRLKYVAPDAPPMTPTRALCNHPPASNIDEDGGIWGPLDEAFVFTGDRYDAATKRVTAGDPTTADGWINIACAGSVIAKMHLHGYTWAAGTAAHGTTLAERNDLIAMYTGNVCGDGRSYTIAGTQIRWTGSNGWHDYNWPTPAAGTEAMWRNGRATCLNTWRIPANQPLITCGATLPSCVGLDTDWSHHDTIKSGLPTP